MAKRYLIDSNVIIDFVNNKFSNQQMDFVEKLPLLISVITRIEILCSNIPTDFQRKKIISFIENSTIFPLN